MDLNSAISILNQQTNAVLPLKKKWEAVFIQASLHIRGYQPSFIALSDNNGNRGRIEPMNYGGDKYDTYFNDFLFSRHPRENPVTRQWRLSQYRPMTKGPLGRLLELVQSGLFADNQYQLSITDTNEQDYIYNDLDLFGFVSQHMPAIIEDPNGYIVQLPTVSRLEQKGKKIELKVIFVGSCDIMAHDDESLLFEHGVFAYLFTLESIFRYKKNTSSQWELEDKDGYYNHFIGELPITKAGGIWNSEGYLNSFFDKAFPVCDEFVAVYSASQMIDKEASHPYIIMAQEQCTTCLGTGSIQVIVPVCEAAPTGHELHQCGTCHGKGQVSISPGDRYNVPAEKMMNDIVKIVNPDVGINTYHSKKEQDLYNRILESLNLLKVMEAQSGTAKALDHEELYKLMGKISLHVFDNIISKHIEYCLEYRNRVIIEGAAKESGIDFTLIKPTQFQVKSSNDLMLEWGESSKANTPSFFRKKILIELSDKRFAGDSIFIKKTQVITEIDDLCVFGTDEQLNMVASGAVSVTDLVYSRKLPATIDSIIREKGGDWFIEATYDEIKKLVDAKLKIEPIIIPAEPAEIP